MSTSTWSTAEILAMAAAIEEEAARLGDAHRPTGPGVSAFGRLLEPPARHTFPGANIDIAGFLDQAGAAVAATAGGLECSAEAYRRTEDEALDLVGRLRELVGSTGGAISPSPAPPGGAAAPTPRAHWAVAGDVLDEGLAAGSDSFAGVNPLRVLVPTGLEWLDFPAAASEMVTSSLTWLAAEVVSWFAPFDQALADLAGDSGAVRATTAALDDLAATLGEHVGSMSRAAALAPNWSGPAAEGFAGHAAVQQQCMAAAEAVVGLVGSSIEGLAQNTAAARRMVVAMVANGVDEIIRYVAPRAVLLQCALGLLAVPFGFVVSAAVLAAMLADFIAWLLELLATEFQVMAEVMGEVAEQGNAYLGQVRQLGESLARAGTALATGADPGTGHGVDDASTAASMLGAGRDPRDGMVIGLLAGRGDQHGFTDVSDDPVVLTELGLTPGMLVDEENGFRARVHRHADGTLVVAFDGTDFGDSQQRDLLLENIPGGTGMGPQSEMAMAIAQAVGSSPAQGAVVYGGHSLGGRLAAIAAMTSGNPAITANAAGVSDATMAYVAQQNGMTLDQLRAETDAGLVRGYRTRDDVLTALQEDWALTSGLMPDAPGAAIDLAGSRGLGGHAATNVADEYDKAYAPGPGRFR